MKRLLIAAATAGVVGLSACGGPTEEAWQTPRLDEGAIATFTCEQATQATTDVKNAVEKGDTRRKDQLGITENQVQHDLTIKLNERVASECKEGEKPKGNGEEADVVGNDGSKDRLPVVTGQPVIGDSTREANTPPVATTEMLQQCSNSATWRKLVDCVGDNQWYKDGVNRMKPYTGFDWNDVLKYADEKGSDGKPYDARVIHVYNWTEAEKPKNVARNDVRGLIGNDELLGKIEVIYHGDFVNSRGLERETVHPFVDKKKQVRISLAPLVRNEKGELRLGTNSGVFIDCLNIWGMPFAITPPGQAAVCPPGTPMAGQPIPGEGPKGCYPPPPGGCEKPDDCTPPPGCTEPNNCQPPGCTEPNNCQPPPCIDNCGNNHKKPGEAPGQPGAPGDGGSTKYGGDGSDRHTADPNPAPPAAGQPPASQQPAPQPPANNPVPSAQPAPTPTATQPPATGAPPPSQAPEQCVPAPGRTCPPRP